MKEEISLEKDLNQNEKMDLIKNRFKKILREMIEIPAKEIAKDVSKHIELISIRDRALK